MRLVDVVLFLHIAVVLIAFGISSVLHTSEWSIASATSVAEIRTLRGTPQRLEPMFPLLIVTLFGLGAWLLHLDSQDFHWSDGWVITSVAALVVLLLAGGTLLDPRSKRLSRLLDADPNGPLTQPAFDALTDRVGWTVSHSSTGLALAIVFIMVVKPTGVVSLAVTIVATTIGTTIGLLGRQRATRQLAIQTT